MKAIYAHGPHDLRLGDIKTDNVTQNDVKIRLKRGGICGSDLHYYQHGGFGTVRLREPMALGHEVSGEVIELGQNVSDLNVGDLVAISPSRPCGDCAKCAQGLPNHCLNMRFYGSAMPFPHIQGAFRQEITAQASQCVKATGLSAGEAAMAEPLSVVLHGLHQAGDIVGARVIVTGCGPIGLLAILAARRAGAAEIIATDIASKSLDFAKKLGADITINTLENPEGLAPFTTDKGTLDVLFECSGAAPALAGAIPALRPRGRIVQLGMSGDMTLPMQQITVKELTLKGSFRFHEEFKTAIEWMRKGLIDVKPLITQTFDFTEFNEAFETASDRNIAMKVQLEFS